MNKLAQLVAVAASQRGCANALTTVSARTRAYLAVRPQLGAAQ